MRNTFTILILLFLSFISNAQQTSTVTLSYNTLAYCNVCGTNYECSDNVYGTWNNGVRTFSDQLPSNATIISIAVKVYYAGTGGSTTVKFNNSVVGNYTNTDNIFCGSCFTNQVSSSNISYNKGGLNSIQLIPTSVICVSKIEVIITYCTLTSTITPSTAQNICSGNTLSFSGSSSTGGTSPSYAWSSSPSGFSSSQQNPTFTAPNISTATNYTLTLTVTDGGCSATKTTTVTVNPKPNNPLIMPSTPQSVCSGNTLSFSGSSGGTSPSYAWSSSPSGFSSSQQNPTFNAPNISTATNYTLTLTVTDGGCSATKTTTVTVNPFPTTAPTISSTNHCTNDLLKIWDKRFGSSEFDQLNSIVPTNDGGYILGGYTSSTASSGDISLDSYGYNDYWVVKINTSGNKVWEKRFGGNDHDNLSSILPTSDGGYLLGGSSWSNIFGDKSQSTRGDYDYWVIKIDANGNKVWDRTLGGNFNDMLSSMVLTSDGGYLLGGYSRSSISGEKSEGGFGLQDYWAVKIDANGNKVWDKRFGGSLDDGITSMLATSDGGYLLGGYSYSDISGNKTQAQIGLVDYWIIKIDALGNKVWDKVYGGTDYNFLSSIIMTNDGKYLLGGISSSDISGNKSQASQGNNDFWIVKIDTNGNKIWDKGYGGSDYDGLFSMFTTNDGGFLLGGTSSSGISGDKTQASQGVSDYWLVKVDAIGTKVWDKTYGGNADDLISLLIPSNDGSYLIGGSSSSDNTGDKSQTSQGDNDFWVIKTVECPNGTTICSGQTLALSGTDCTGSLIWSNGAGTGATISVSPTISTSYTATCVQNGCASNSSNIFFVNVINPPIPTANNITICSGNTANLTASGCSGTYKWYSSSSSTTILANTATFVSPPLTSATTYYISCTQNNCESIRGTVLVSVNALPTAPIVATPNPICIGQSTALTAIGCTGAVSWTGGLTGSSITLNPTNSRSYRALCTNANACKSDSSISVNLIVNPIPNAPLVTSPGNCSNDLVKIWDKQFGGSANDALTSVVATSDGGYLLGGYSYSNISGDRNEATRGGADYWVIKVSPNGEKIWDKRFGGSGDDLLTSVVLTVDGGYLLGGQSLSGLNGDKSQASQGGVDFWIIKIDASGNKLWDKRFGGSGTESLSALINTYDGGYLLGGLSSSGQNGDKSQASQGQNDYWIVKIDANGSKVWDKRFGGTQVDNLKTIIATSDGNYLLGGDSNSPLSGDKSQILKGQSDFWVVKIDVSGTKIWDKTLGGSYSETLTSFLNTSDGGYIIGGSTSSGIEGDISQPSQGFEDYWIVKVNSNGIKQWDKRFGGYNGQKITSITNSKDGGYLLAGQSYSGQTGDKTQPSQGGYDYWIVKIDVNGGKITDKTFGGSSTETFGKIINTLDGNYLLTGYSTSFQSGDKSENGQGGSDYWIAKVSSCLTGAYSCGSQSLTLTATGCNGLITWSNAATGANITVSPSSSTNYLATCTQNACVSSNSNTFSINISTPVPPTISDTTICSDMSAYLTATGCTGSYKWYSSNTGTTILANTPNFSTPYLSSNTTYYVSCTKNNCESSRSPVLVIVNERPLAPMISTPDPICMGQSTILNATNCTGSVFWSGGQSGSSITVSPSISQDYSAICRGGNNCYSDYTFVSLVVMPKPAAPYISAPNSCTNDSLKVWDKRFGGNFNEKLSAMIPISDGGYLLGGFSGSDISGDKSQASQGGLDYWIVKIDSNGNKIWDKRFGGSENDQILSMQPINTGGYLLAGSSGSGISEDKSQPSQGDLDYWVVKIDTDGNKIWDKRFGGNGDDQLSSVILTSDGGFLLGGTSSSDISGDKSQLSRGGFDYWVVKIDADGNKIWDKSFGGMQDDALSSIVATNGGSYLLGGYSYSNYSNDKSQLSQGGSDYWVVKIDTDGNKIWDKSFGGIADDKITSITTAGQNDYLLAGTSWSDISGDKGQVLRGSSDFWIIKIDTDGNKIWDKSFGGNNDEGLIAIQRIQGGYLLGGYSSSDISGDKSQASQGGSDYWIVKIDNDGNKIWDKRFGGSDYEQIFSMLSTTDGGYLLGGQTNSGISGNKSQASQGYSDYWIVKVRECKSTSTICSGQSINLSATGCDGVINWSNGGGTGSSISVSPTNNTSYIATCFQNNCTSDNSNPVFIDINAMCQCLLNASITSGNWGTAGIWSCGHIPLITEPVQISSGHTVTLDVNGVAKSLDLRGILNQQATKALFIQGN